MGYTKGETVVAGARRIKAPTKIKARIKGASQYFFRTLRKSIMSLISPIRKAFHAVGGY
jgi:hypothetical protein